MSAVLIVVGGLPATGKSSLCALVARRTRMPWLRVDRIEDAIVRSTALEHPVGVVGYAVAYALAAEQLRHGIDVIAECVNPLLVTREAWRQIAVQEQARLLEVEVICSDASEHHRRAVTRQVDIDGHPLPTWEAITGREYQDWDRDHLVIDTARSSVDDGAAQIIHAAWPTG